MLKKLFVLTVIVNLLVLPLVVKAQAKQKIILLLYNGKVFTADAQFTLAEAIAVDGEKIVTVGTTNELRNKYSSRRKEIDLQGKLVTPGFNDAHVHFLRGALSLLTVNLLECENG